MEYEDLKNKNSNSISAAYDSEYQNNGISQQPPEFGAAYHPDLRIPVRLEPDNRDYEADYNRLKNDNIEPIEESKIWIHKKLGLFRHNGFLVYKEKSSLQPWFIKKESNTGEKAEPYTEGYRKEVLLDIREKPQQRKYVEFSGVKLKIAPEGSPISIDNGGTIGLESGDLSFDFDVTNGNFTIKTKLIPLGEVSGNIFKYPDFGLDAELKPQLGPITFDPATNKFEVELKIPGLPLSPSITISAKINQKAVQQDFEQIVQYEWFPFIGKIIDTLNQN